MINFTGAKININALSDTHGKLDLADRGFQTLMAPKNDAFIKEKPGNKNFVIIGGDWFISGGKKGFLSAPDKPLIKFQAEVLNKFIAKIKEKFPTTCALFMVGNHEFDGGGKLLYQTLKDINADTVITNLDYDNSPALQDLIREEKVVDSKINFVQDDKDPNKSYAILNLGVAPVNLAYYSKDTEGMALVDNTCTAQKFVKPEQFEKTKQAVLNKIKEFKKQYPDGVVILTSHTGVNFAEECAKSAPIDLIFNGHEHKNDIKLVNKTPVVSMSQNFKRLLTQKLK